MMASVAVESIVVSPPTDGDSSTTTTTTTTTEMVRPPRRTSSMHLSTLPIPNEQPQPTEWGHNFWVTLVDPQTQTQFYACPSTGQTTWDAPVGNFVLPPSADGEWWELRDETRGGIPYYYHTKSGDTTWTKPDGFVIPLGVIQNTSLGRKLSQSTRRNSQLFADTQFVQFTPTPSPRRHIHPSRRSTAHTSPPSVISERTEEASRSASPKDPDDEKSRERSDEDKSRERSGDKRRERSDEDKSHESSGDKRRGRSDEEKRRERSREDKRHNRSEEDRRNTRPDNKHHHNHTRTSPTTPTHTNTNTQHRTPPSASSTSSASPRSRSKSSGPLSGTSTSRTAPPAQSLTAAVEFLAASSPIKDTTSAPSFPTEHERARARSRSRTPERRRTSIGALRLASKSPGLSTGGGSVPGTPTRPIISPTRPIISPLRVPNGSSTPKSTRPPIPAVPSPSSAHSHDGGFWRQRRNTSAGGMAHIGHPVLDPDATRHMSPVQRNAAKPIHVATKRLSTGEHPLLPRDLVSEIEQFAQSDFARRYFSTHREGIIFRRRVPVERMMMWQKAPLTSPLLVMNKSLHRNAVRAFKVVQRIMGDRDRDRPVGVRHTDSSSSLASVAALGAGAGSLLEEERWLLGEGVLYGEMRDEIYCQVVKQLSGNSNTESTFRGWQLMCVLLVTFPPSKNFEPYVRGFMQRSTTQAEGRVDVMAKYCLQRLSAIAKKGPRGKPPSLAEIESASDAAFNPSTFGESLDAILRLQARTYADFKVPVILPFLADGILALGGTKLEGIFRVPGDADAVSALRLRLDKGVYTLDGIDDAHVPASLLKLWLRELLDPLVPAELYNECVACAGEPGRVVEMVGRLPTINRRVVLFVVSFLQLFLEERVLAATKMTSANLALVMAPNLLRCNSDSMSVVFTNAQYEQRFVHNLLLHLRCDRVDPEYVPEHGKGAVMSTAHGRKSHQKTRRAKA